MDIPTIDVITTAVAPIVMVSASGLLFIGIQTKNLHLADRLRDLIMVTALLLAAAPWAGRTGQAWPVAAVAFTIGIAFLLVAIVLELVEMRTGLRTLRIEIRSALDGR